ncbi:DUF3784 domain-containing protein [Parabacteroides sp. PF5-9]|uniref:DUF3784 domain-containing protein n=1 Tax=Parabacteroides sp. PF5-9 TaxID=1742404 RepID=UPI0024733906|nr:DUF3784 domain-containing protein [Parabacteroides sp. PF5-9]MDH6358055.1 putative membrane protein [Parabacteroides sp. PF5-9]
MTTIVEYIIGLFFIACGFLIEKYPMVLSGYNTMKKEDREAIRSTGIIRIIRIIFVAMGLVLIVGAFLLSVSGYTSFLDLWTTMVIVGGLAVLTGMQYKYTKHIAASRQQVYISCVVLIFILLIRLCFWV